MHIRQRSCDDTDTVASPPYVTCVCVMFAVIGPSSVLVSRKLSKIDPQLLLNTIRNRKSTSLTTVVSPRVSSSVVNKVRRSEPVVHNRHLWHQAGGGPACFDGVIYAYLRLVIVKR